MAFNPNPGLTKAITSPEGDGISRGEDPASGPSKTINTFNIDVKNLRALGSDATATFTGPGAGVAAGGSDGGGDEEHGFTTATGNKIAIKGTPGSETIELVHHSGAGIIIDGDGSIFIVPTGKRGWGMHSGAGDGVLGANRIVIKGASDITLETDGNIQMNVGGSMFTKIDGDYILDVGGTYALGVDGAMSTQVVKDMGTTVGGMLRETVAGDMRTQVVGDIRVDGGRKIDLRAKEDMMAQSQKSMKIMAKENSNFSVGTGTLKLDSKGDLHLGSQAAMYVSSDDDLTLEAPDSLSIRSGGNMVMSSKAGLYIDAATAAEFVSPTTTVSATTALNLEGQAVSISASGAMEIDATGNINIDSSGDVRTQTAGASPVPPKAPATTTPRKIEPPGSPEAPEFPTREEIIDSMSTEREAPQFENGKKMTAHDAAILENEGDTVPDPVKRASSRNSGGGSPYRNGAGMGEIPNSASSSYDGNYSTMASKTSPTPGPSSIYNASEKLSDMVSVGMFPGLTRCPTSQMGYSRQQIVENVKHLCFNILDPVLRQFGNRVTLTHGIRIGSGGSRHYIGKAIDLRSSTRDHAETAEIAKWIVQNTPFDRVFLEANHQGGIHIHAEAAPPGGTGSKTVWTCSDPQCRSRVNGLQLSYAKQGLRRMSGY